MKIKSLTFQNHPLFGNLSLNFCDPSGKPYDFIVIAGENGTGKTQLLELIYGFSGNQNNFTISFTDSILAEFEMSDFEKNLIAEKKSINSLEHLNLFYDHLILNKIFLSIKSIRNNSYYQVFIPKKYASNFINDDIVFNVNDLLQWFFYSPVDSNFAIGSVSVVSNKVLDKKEVHETKQSSSIGQEINQLFVDITNQDNSDLSRWVENNDGVAPPESVKTQRIKRFRLAFQKILPNKLFVGSHNNNGAFNSMFKFNGHEIPLENLSHGEKQIILRSGFILRNQNAAKGSIILIDEIEMGLHPALQEKILEYYADLVKFSDYQNQVIVTTHSPFTVHNQMRNLKVIILKNQSGQVVVDENPTFAKITPKESVERALNVSLPIRPTILTEGKTDVAILLTAWKKLYKDKPLPFEIKTSGIGKTTGNAHRVKAAIEHLAELVSEFPVLGLLDHDTEGKGQFNGLKSEQGFIVDSINPNLKTHETSPAHLLLLPVIPSRKQFVNDNQNCCFLSIEHYFSDTVLQANHLKGKLEIIDTQIFSICGDKVKFAEHVVQNLNEQEFSEFKQLFETIAKILNVQI